jgi:hypothetical protein
MQSVPWTKLVLLVIALLGGVAFGTYKSHQGSLVQVFVSVPQNIQLSVYEDRGGDGAYNYDASKSPLFMISSSQKLALGIGKTYDFVADNPNSKYSNPVTKETIAYGTEVSIQLSYCSQKLASLLPSVRQSALKALYAKYPPIQQNYVAAKDQLYMLGDWYGVVLQPKDASQDAVRAIMHKKGSTWSLAIRHPDLSIGMPSNPDIAQAIIEQVDKL